MISISTIVANPDGNVIIKNHSGSRLKEKSFRVSRTKTLDGGAYINHGGYSDGDRTLYVNGKITHEQETILNTITKLYTSFLISMDDGLYLGSIKSMSAENGALKMTIYLEQKEN